MADTLNFYYSVCCLTKTVTPFTSLANVQVFCFMAKQTFSSCPKQANCEPFPPLLSNCEDGEMVRIPVDFFSLSCFLSRNSGRGGGSMLRLNHKNFLNPVPPFFSEFIFNWRIIALQHCVGFCYMSA